MTSMPTYPTGSGPTANEMGQPRLAPPADVLMSVKLWFASIAVALVGGIASYLMTDQTAAVKEMADADTSGLTEAQIQTAVNVGLVVALVFSLVLIGLQLLFVFKMKAGRNWARIVLTVLAGLSALMTLISLTQGFSIGTATNLISLVATVGAVVFMFRPAAKPYFSAPRS
ncbi:hypothetical protein [Pengzhenrongella frigida]|uniref:Uncharacterized protein n=1 Tax=Pengzhenrongella frigida TaxID=1259133 RepID=A0A4Q5N0R9_9MICO|nr:hypothetical protein [Cellulomonas sp. HLT2-17]RYV51752.1 hypothetical protein EUA98_06680 [Cellulomonas sp. HLT2-17]